MKNYLYFFLAFILLPSCEKISKEFGSSSANSAILSKNSKEDSLIGMWRETRFQRRHINPIYISMDTVINFTDTSAFVDFTKDLYFPKSNSSNWEDFKIANYALYGALTPHPVYWKYDESKSALILGAALYEVIDLTQNQFIALQKNIYFEELHFFSK
jgi:hypothetical protein